MCASRLSTAYTVVQARRGAQRFVLRVLGEHESSGFALGAISVPRSAASATTYWYGCTLPFLARNVPDEGNLISGVDSSFPAVLPERASLQPNDTALTFLDYDQDWDGVAVSLTWSQLYRRAVNLGEQLRLRASTGDRALILAPQ